MSASSDAAAFRTRCRSLRRQNSICPISQELRTSFDVVGNRWDYVLLQRQQTYLLGTKHQQSVQAGKSK
jgi:hypothetical protein